MSRVYLSTEVIQRVLGEIEQRGQAAYEANPDYAKGLAEAYELIAGCLPKQASTLAPCHFCGRTVTIQPHRRGNYRRTGTRYQAVCNYNKCRARGPIRDTEADAAVAHTSGAR